MALKRLKTKRSKRLTLRLKHKIEKKVREHNRKERKEKKQNAKGKKRKMVQIPNICPFKDEILKDVEEVKKRAEAEKERRREVCKTAKTENKFKSLEAMVVDADMRGAVHSVTHKENSQTDEKEYKGDTIKENTVKQYFKEFKKVIENADVILEVVDARDPLGTRCIEVERLVKSASGNKRLVLILNKADLVPKENLNNWIKYFRKLGPVTAFKASTQDQSHKLGRRKFNQMKTEKAMQGSMCVGAELLMSMLANYCRNKGIKTSIRVGVVGIPNVGKSSVINSLTRGKTCSVGCTPGVTKVMQEVELDSKIKLFDCPGIVFTSGNQSGSLPAVLKNAQKVSDVKDPFTIAESVLKRANKEYFCKLYDITSYDSFEEFFAKKAARMGKFLKKGIPDVTTAARSVLNDWNSGKIKYCTQPPEVDKTDVIHISASIIHDHEQAREFDVENFETMETEILNTFNVQADEFMEITSGGPVECKATTLLDDKRKRPAIIEETNESPKTKERKRIETEEANVKHDPTMNLEGNQSLNKSMKDKLKKQKKRLIRDNKKVSNISDELEDITLNISEEKYDFDSDFVME